MKLVETKQKLPDTEKVTINLGLVDLAQMDLLVEEGFYTNRTDVVRKRFVVGLQRYTRTELERSVAAGERLEIHVLGLASIDDDVTAELAAAAIASIWVLGAFVASNTVKSALADRIHI
jgi:Arc/MetJ-type ribon-helix-helix transcriptional regulator